MLSKEEYQRTVVRMWDSLRDDKKGEPNCYGVDCEECPLWEKACVAALPVGSYSTVFSVYNAIEIVEQWGKEHPVMTNGDKFKEVFGVDPLTGLPNRSNAFWGSEYIPPKKEESNE